MDFQKTIKVKNCNYQNEIYKTSSILKLSYIYICNLLLLSSIHPFVFQSQNFRTNKLRFICNPPDNYLYLKINLMILNKIQTLNTCNTPFMYINYLAAPVQCIQNRKQEDSPEQNCMSAKLNI